jgi:hypothetical protein
MTALGLALLALAVPALGRPLVRRIAPPPNHWATELGLALALGLAALLLLLTAPLALAGRVSFWPAGLALGGALCAAAWQAWRQRSFGLPARGAVVLGLAAAGAVCFARADAFASYDERAIYGLKAKALWFERGVGGPLFQDPDVVHFHPDYPLGLPLWMALVAEVAQTAAPTVAAAGAPPADRWAQASGALEHSAALAVLWSCGLALLLFGWLRERGVARWAALCLTPLTLPVTLLVPASADRSWSWSGADLPLALLVGAAAALVCRGARPAEPRAVAAATLLVAVGALLKQDAALSLLALVGATGVTRATWRPLALGLCAGAVPLALLFAVRARLPDPPFPDAYLASIGSRSLGTYLERLPLLFERAVAVLDTQGLAVFWGAALLFGVPWACSSGSGCARLGRWVATHTALTLGVFLVTPHPLDWHVSTALPRVLSHAALPAGLLLAGALVAALAPRPSGELDRSGPHRPWLPRA